MEKCKQHEIEYSYTCHVCEYELKYIGETYLLRHFREGFFGKQFKGINIHDQSAYERGKEFKIALKLKEK